MISRRKPKGWLGWVVGKLTRPDAVINREGPWPEDLARVLGSERRSHSEVKVRDALRQIRDMHGERLKATRRTMRLSAGIGAYAGLCGTLAVGVLLLRWFRGEPGPYLHYLTLPDSAPQWIRGAWDIVAQMCMVAWALTVPFLLAGCSALAFCRNWGRRTLVWVFGTWMVIVTVLIAGELAAAPFSGPHKLTFLGGVASALVGLLFCWVLVRSVRSPAIQEICRAYAKEPDSDSDGALTTQA